MRIEDSIAVILELETGAYDGYYHNQTEHSLNELVDIWDEKRPDYSHVWAVFDRPPYTPAIPSEVHLPTVYIQDIDDADQ